MRKINAHDLVREAKDFLFDQPDEKFTLVFDDGEMVTTRRRTLISSYMWEVHREHSRLPILKRHHIGNGIFTSNTVNKILSNVARDMHELVGEDNYKREELWRQFHVIINDIYNVFSTALEAYVTSVNSFDFLEVYDHPPIKAIREGIKNTNVSVVRGYEKASDVFYQDEAIAHNQSIKNLRGGLVNGEQFNQIIVTRGFTTDHESTIFRNRVSGNYFSGIRSYAEALMESRTATKAIIFTKAPLKAVEYFNRKVQLSTHQVANIVMEDCGSEYFHEIEMNATRLRDFEGKYYLLEGELNGGRNHYHTVQRSHQHLNGKTIFMRSAMFCKYRASGTICKTCMGELAYSVPYGTNVGHVSATVFCGQSSQLVLKIKHIERSSGVDPVIISEEERTYVLNGEEPTHIRLNPKLKDKKVTLIISALAKQNVDNASTISALSLKDIYPEMPLHRFSTLKDVSFEHVTDEGVTMRYHIPVSRGARLSSLSYYFIKFMLEQQFTIGEDGAYHIDLEQWDFDRQAFELPSRHVSMLDYMSEVEVMYRSTREESTRHLGKIPLLTSYKNPTHALLDLHDLVSTRLEVNIAHLENMLLALSAPAHDKNDYRLPEYGQEIRFVKHGQAIAHRSMGVTMAFEDQVRVMEDMQQYLETDRNPHMLDPILMPELLNRP